MTRFSQGTEVQKARHPRLAHRRGGAGRCPHPGSCLLGGKEKLDERLARAREQQNSGERGKNAAMVTFEASRPAVGAQAVGIARAAYEVALDYAKTRVQFGRPVIDNQGVAFALADMRTRIDAARLLMWRASWIDATASRSPGRQRLHP